MSDIFYRFPNNSSLFNSTSSVTRLGDFWKLLAISFQAIFAEIFEDFLGYFEKCTFSQKTAVSIFGPSLKKFKLFFILR